MQRQHKGTNDLGGEISRKYVCVNFSFQNNNANGKDYCNKSEVGEMYQKISPTVSYVVHMYIPLYMFI